MKSVGASSLHEQYGNPVVEAERGVTGGVTFEL